MNTIRTSALLPLLLLLACTAPADDAPLADSARTPSTGAARTAAADSARAPAATPPHVIHPDHAGVGDTVVGLRIETVDVRRASDGEFVGTVRFAGEVRVSGRYQPHVDREVDATCFFADEASAARLPRFPHDQRRAWFCFENPDEARVMLRVPPDSGSASILIDRFTYYFYPTDVVNQARLVRVTAQGR